MPNLDEWPGPGMRGLIFAVVLALVLGLAPRAVAATPGAPLLSPRTAIGVWEGLCQSADENDVAVLGVRLRVRRDRSGTLTIGRWFGGDPPFTGRVLALSKLEVSAGKVQVTASSDAADGWRQVTMNGTGRAFPESGWLKVKLEIADTVYRCEALLVRSTPRLFKELPALLRSLEALEKERSTNSPPK